MPRRDTQIQGKRYLVHFSDGGAGPRNFDRELDVGAELHEWGRRYEVDRVDQPSALGSRP